LVKCLAQAVSINGSFGPLAGKIGIVTPYKAQVKELKDVFAPWLKYQLKDIQIDTVDAFQGRELDIIIVNTVRSNNHKGLRARLGFLMDHRRMNVAITRPRHFLYIVGNSHTLQQDSIWGKLVKSYKNK
jgi:superfamily I DNA and/or RNA helicase